MGEHGVLLCAQTERCEDVCHRFGEESLFSLAFALSRTHRCKRTHTTVCARPRMRVAASGSQNMKR